MQNSDKGSGKKRAEILSGLYEAHEAARAGYLAIVIEPFISPPEFRRSTELRQQMFRLENQIAVVEREAGGRERL